MKTSKTASALFALMAAATLSTAAFADESPKGFAHESIGTPKTRAEVIADFQHARQDGELNELWKDGTVEMPTQNSIVTRAEVLAELREAQASGEFALLHANEPALVKVHAHSAASTAVSSATLR